MSSGHGWNFPTGCSVKVDLKRLADGLGSGDMWIQRRLGVQKESLYLLE